jgi:hypothetical protein
MSFWEKGYDAIFITSYYKNPYMHTPKDTIDWLEPQYLHRVGRMITLVVLVLANER